MAYGSINVPGLDKFDLLEAGEKAIPENSDFLLGVEGEEFIRVPASGFIPRKELGNANGAAGLDEFGELQKNEMSNLDFTKGDIEANSPFARIPYCSLLFWKGRIWSFAEVEYKKGYYVNSWDKNLENQETYSCQSDLNGTCKCAFSAGDYVYMVTQGYDESDNDWHSHVYYSNSDLLTTWTEITSLKDVFMDLCDVNAKKIYGKYVLWGRNAGNSVFVSDDGLSWTAKILPNCSGVAGDFSIVPYNNAVYIYYRGENDFNYVCTSDWNSWSAQGDLFNTPEAPSASGGFWNCGNKIYGLSYSGKISESEDGINFSRCGQLDFYLSSRVNGSKIYTAGSLAIIIDPYQLNELTGASCSGFNNTRNWIFVFDSISKAVRRFYLPRGFVPRSVTGSVICSEDAANVFVTGYTRNSGQTFSSALIRIPLEIPAAYQEKPYVVGSYTGDGTSTRKIDVGFTPSHVVVFGNQAVSFKTADMDIVLSRNGSYGSYPLPKTCYTAEDGFMVGTSDGYNTSYSTNGNGVKFTFIAYR